MQIIVSIGGLSQKVKTGVVEYYHIAATEEALYIIKAKSNYSELVKLIFLGVSEGAGFLGGLTGIVGGALIGYTGEQFSKMLDYYASSSSQKKIDKILQNLEKAAFKKKGVIKIKYPNLSRFIYKKGYVLTGKSYIAIISTELTLLLNIKKHYDIDQLKNILLKHTKSIDIRRRWI